MGAYIAGIGVVAPPPEQDPSLEELVFESTRAALNDAGLERGDIDGVCLSSSDQLDGRAISSMHLASPSGARMRDEIKVADDGVLALAAAVMRIEAGVSRRVLVTSWTKPRASDAAAALGVNAEPIFTRLVGLHPWVAEAMVVEQFMDAAGLDVERLDEWARRLGEESADGEEWLCYPLRRGHLPPPTEAAVTLVVSADPAEVVVRGLSWGVDPADPTDRGGFAGSLPSIASRAYSEAGLATPRGVPVETTDRSVARRGIAAVGLGLCDISEVTSAMDGTLAGLNDGGGLWRSNPIFAAGLECVASAARRVRAGAEAAIGHSSYGFAGQGNLVTVLGKVSG